MHFSVTKEANLGLYRYTDGDPETDVHIILAQAIKLLSAASDREKKEIVLHGEAPAWVYMAVFQAAIRCQFERIYWSDGKQQKLLIR